MTVTVSGQRLTGVATAPASKSILHRLLICAALGDREVTLTHTTLSQDIEATAACLEALGATVRCTGDRIMVTPLSTVRTDALLDCGESGSTLRFLLPIAAALGGARFTGRGRLAERPLSPLYELLCENGCRLSPQGTFPLSVEGTLCGRQWDIDGSVSSQFISGLLMAMPLLGGGKVVVTGKVESRPYIDLTIAAMRQFGVDIAVDGNVYRIPDGAAYRSPTVLAAEGDWSNGAFWLVAGALTPQAALTVQGLSATSLQGDRAIVGLLQSAGVSVSVEADNWRVSGVPTRPLTVDVADIPDLVPVLAVLAAAAPGRSVIGNARRLRLKESDRLCSVCAMLTALGGKVTMTDDALLIDGTGQLRGGVVDTYNDHRIAMAAAVAACLCEEPVEIRGAEAVRKSYPSFFNEFAERGMRVCPPYSGEN